MSKYITKHYNRRCYDECMKKPLTINVFTDPNCPYAYSAEPIRWRLQWLYGDQLKWDTSMIVLSGYDGEVPTITTEQSASFQEGIRQKYHMPIDTTVRPRTVQTIVAARAFVAVNRHNPAAANQLLRNLRVASMGGELIDEQAVINDAAKKAGIDTAHLSQWISEAETEKILNSQAKAARNPNPQRAAFAHKLAKTSTGRVRYSAPSYQFISDEKVTFELPGFWPLEAYDAIIGNMNPAIERNASPKSVTKVLQWAQTPLATIEVATIMDQSIEKVRSNLNNIANFSPVGQDGFWTLK